MPCAACKEVRMEIISILTTLHSEQGITLVTVTHDASIANRCQRIIHFKDGQVVTEEAS